MLTFFWTVNEILDHITFGLVPLPAVTLPLILVVGGVGAGVERWQRRRARSIERRRRMEFDALSSELGLLLQVVGKDAPRVLQALQVGMHMARELGPVGEESAARRITGVLQRVGEDIHKV